MRRWLALFPLVLMLAGYLGSYLAIRESSTMPGPRPGTLVQLNYYRMTEQDDVTELLTRLHLPLSLFESEILGHVIFAELYRHDLGPLPIHEHSKP